MKKIILVTITFFICNLSNAQALFKAASDLLTPMPAPTYKLYETRPGMVHSIELSDNDRIPLELYTNLQCTEFILADYSGHLCPTVNLMMQIPNSNQRLFAVEIGGLSEYAKTVLVIVNGSGYVTDVLEAEVFWGPPKMSVKQTYIDENFNVIVHTIHPLSSDSISPFIFSSFQGQREDICYRIVNGKFIETDKTTYRTRTFRQNDLTRNLWEGPDIPLLQKPTPPKQSEIPER